MVITQLKRKKIDTFEERQALAIRLSGLEKQKPDLADGYAPEGEQITHHIVCDLVGEYDRKVSGLLYLRPFLHEEELWIRSGKPVEEEAAEMYGYQIQSVTDCDEMESDLQNGDIVQIRYGRLVPIRSIVNPDTGKKQKIAIRDPEERLQWAKNVLRKHGAEPIEHEAFPHMHVRELFRETLSFVHSANEQGRKKKREGYVQSFGYTGFVEITDADAFRTALREGIGRNKAYGCGMLLIRSTGRNVRL